GFPGSGSDSLCRDSCRPEEAWPHDWRKRSVHCGAGAQCWSDASHKQHEGVRACAQADAGELDKPILEILVRVPARSGNLINSSPDYCNCFSIASVTSLESGVTAGSNRCTTLPLRSTRNLVKFHLISPDRPAPVSFVRYPYSGAWSAPF